MDLKIFNNNKHFNKIIVKMNKILHKSNKIIQQKEIYNILCQFIKTNIINFSINIHALCLFQYYFVNNNFNNHKYHFVISDIV